MENVKDSIMRSTNIDQFSRAVHKNSTLNVMLRGVGVGFSLLLTRINISYLGISIYGLWATIASVSSWANFCDLGISNGLRNKLAKAVADGDEKSQNDLIASAVLVLSKISIVLYVVLSVVSELLFFLGIIQSSLRAPMYITNFFFCVSLVLGISRSIAYSYQRSWLASLAQTSTTILQIIGVALLLAISVHPNLIAFACINGVASILGNLIIILILKKGSGLSFVTTNPIEASRGNEIIDIGVRFFVLQLCGLILYATDNVIINKLFDSGQVTKYSVITSVYTTGGQFFSLLLVSLWSAVTYASVKQEYNWIIKEINTLKRLWVVFACGVIVVSALFNNIVDIWLGESILHYDFGLIGVFAVYSLLNAFGSIYVNVANGLGRVKQQMIMAVIGAIVNIPLSIFLASSCGLGLTGIKLATLLCSGVVWVVLPIDVTQYLKKMKNLTKTQNSNIGKDGTRKDILPRCAQEEECK